MDYRISLMNLTLFNSTIERLVNNFICEMDISVVLDEISKKKFKQYASLIDTNSRYIFKNSITLTLKCAYGFNQHTSCNNLINSYSENKCIRYRNKEDWLHIIKYLEIIEIRDEWRILMIKQMQHIVK